MSYLSPSPSADVRLIMLFTLSREAGIGRWPRMTLITFHLKHWVNSATATTTATTTSKTVAIKIVWYTSQPTQMDIGYSTHLPCSATLSFLPLSLSACLNLFVRSHDHALRRFVLMPCAVQMFTQRAADASDEMVPILSSQKRICLSPSESESLMCTQTSVMWQLSGERSLPI